MSTVQSNGSVVTNGLVLYIDPGNSISYVSGSTTLRDLTINKFTGSFTGNYGYSNNNGGVMTFTSIDSYYTLPGADRIINGKSNASLNTWINASGSAFYASVGFCRNNNGGPRFSIALDNNTKIVYWVTEHTLVTYSGLAIPSNISSSWLNISLTYDGAASNKVLGYINGVMLIDTPSVGTFPISMSNNMAPFNVGNIVHPASTTYVSTVSIYDRTLTPQEVLQNYNALKGRFQLP